MTDNIGWDPVSLELMRLRHDSQEHLPVYICTGCGGEIYEGDDYYDILGEILCSECIEFCRREATWE